MSALSLALLLCLQPAAPHGRGVVHKASAADSFDRISQRYFGDRAHAAVLQAKNPGGVRPGALVIIPSYYTLPLGAGSSLEDFARRHLYRAGRAGYLRILLQGPKGTPPIGPDTRLKVVDSVPYRVRGGDSLTSIARRFYGGRGLKRRVALLRAYNLIEGGVSAGQKLRLPLDGPEYARGRLLARKKARQAKPAVQPTEDKRSRQAERRRAPPRKARTPKPPRRRVAAAKKPAPEPKPTVAPKPAARPKPAKRAASSKPKPTRKAAPPARHRSAKIIKRRDRPRVRQRPAAAPKPARAAAIPAKRPAAARAKPQPPAKPTPQAPAKPKPHAIAKPKPHAIAKPKTQAPAKRAESASPKAPEPALIPTPARAEAAASQPAPAPAAQPAPALELPEPAAPTASALRAAQTAYDKGAYRRALVLARGGLRTARKGPGQLPLLRVIASAQVALGQPKQATASFRQILKLNPRFSLDPKKTSPKIIEALEAAR